MKKSNYTVFIVSDDDHFQRSFKLSKWFISVLLLFIIGIISLSVVGFLRLSGNDNLHSELKDLRVFKEQASNIIEDTGGMELIHKSDYESTLLEYFSGDSIPNIAPVSGYVTQVVDLNSEIPHFGIDIAATSGETIISPMDGIVIFSGESGGMGNTIIMTHKFGFVTLFSHNKSNLVNERDVIKKGQSIATVGETGTSDGPHLHFEVWKYGEVLDPIILIKEYQDKNVSIQ
jgi:murein DD-endopeptidase MepM/ murein hydrolase activator NlpD